LRLLLLIVVLAGPGVALAQSVAPAQTDPAQTDDDALDAEFDAEFEQDARPLPAIATGPVARGRLALSADVGWLRSGLQAALGLGHGLDIIFRGEAFLLYDGLSGQNGLEAALRYTPVRGGRLRVGLEAGAGQVLAAAEGVSGSFSTLHAEATAGLVLGFTTVYARAGIRGLRERGFVDSRWGHDEEVGAGVEARWRKVVGGAELSRWLRPDLDGITQWRLRAGYAL
jgi:hypothetical protein